MVRGGRSETLFFFLGPRSSLCSFLLPLSPPTSVVLRHDPEFQKFRRTEAWSRTQKLGEVLAFPFHDSAAIPNLASIMWLPLFLQVGYTLMKHLPEVILSTQDLGSCSASMQ
ncbi:hypothetical protein QN277_004060 [Acacia crassicarpa]|uniref:Uncharacterized protein n=1 Tax=Acacia crassicarpa TaxID=499986 RepID=A0AAE1K0L6_9FABA|nr:hypothetical protein QN277_004060 [Acacia crassicarpa]